MVFLLKTEIKKSENETLDSFAALKREEQILKIFHDVVTSCEVFH